MRLACVALAATLVLSATSARADDFRGQRELNALSAAARAQERWAVRIHQGHENRRNTIRGARSARRFDKP